MSQPVAAKQILVHQDTMFLIDAAGQLWWKDVMQVRWSPEVEWIRVVLPPVAPR